jgi:hypothetical protein
LALFGGTPIIPAAAFCVPSAMFLALELTLDAAIVIAHFIAIHDLFFPLLVRRQLNSPNDFSVMAKTLLSREKQGGANTAMEGEGRIG